MAATVEAPAATPYWAEKPNIAPIKSSYVIWDRIIGGRVVDGKPSPAATATEEKVAEPRELDDDDAAEGRPNASSSKGAVSDLTRSTEEPPRKKQKGQNKGRQFARIQDGGLKLCSFTSRGEQCARLQDGLTCDLNHDIKIYLQEQKKADIQTEKGGENESQHLQSKCPIYSNYGACPFGFKCRFSTSHMDDLPEGEGFQGSGKALSIDQEKLRQACPQDLTTDEEKLQWLYRTRGEKNVVTPSRIAELRRIKTQDLPKTRAYLTSIGEPLDTRAAMGKHKGKGNNRQKGTKGGDDKTNGEPAAQEAASLPDASTETPLRPVEKKRLNFEGKLYLAPLTTVGNLPFRRLCVGYGADITCGEMGLAQEFLSGNKNEWSLVRRHPSEKCFGIQLCGNKPQTLVSATEQIKSECPDLDFIDVNMGCPIDLVVKKGGGSALLESGSKVGKILGGMNLVANETPITIKMRTGIKTGVNTTHKLMSRVVRDWGVGALTIHGRSQQQRYTKLADYDYIKTCADELRYRADELDMPAVPIFGNGDAYDHRSYWENVESSGVDGIMIARGALIKPWLFTEIKERRDWDISSRERLDMIGNLASYGLEHWGSDTVGVNTTRRFMCEALSFQYRYVPVGILERLPARLNDRPYPFNGRDELESLLVSDNYMDWIKITSMFLGPPDEDFQFVPKHKSNAYDNAEQANG